MVHHGPEALARHQRRGGLHHGVAAGGQALVQQGVEAVGVELADGEVGRVGKSTTITSKVSALLQPLEGVGVDDVQRVQRIAIEPAWRWS
jgi:ribosome maturation factor RimP